MKPMKNNSRRLTRKQKKFADYLLKNPKATPTEAVEQVYDKTTKHTARVIASENMTKPDILAYLNEHDVEAQHTVISVMMNARKRSSEAQFQRLAFDSANSVLDRVHGKAVQQVKTESTNLNINVEANKELGDNFAEFLRGKTTV